MSRRRNRSRAGTVSLQSGAVTLSEPPEGADPRDAAQRDLAAALERHTHAIARLVAALDEHSSLLGRIAADLHQHTSAMQDLTQEPLIDAEALEGHRRAMNNLGGWIEDHVEALPRLR